MRSVFPIKKGVMEMRINLKKEFFSDREFIIAENGNMKATAFKYSTGIEAIKVENSKGYFIILPYKGQQIWRANFLGNELVMRTMMEEPQQSNVYLETYGGFLLHCGVCAFGVPQSDDTHAQHGETPNADYQEAYIECGEDYMAVGGKLYYDKSFVRNHTFNPECRLYEDDTVLKIKVNLENRRATDMEYMYLCHINFRPIDGAELISSADYDNIKVYKSVGDDLPKDHAEKLLNYMNAVEENPRLMNKVGAEGQIYNPEICFGIPYKGDENNRAYNLQYTEKGACYVSHPTDVLPYSIRWISRTATEDSMGMVLPSTGEHLGYSNAKRNGEVKILPGYGKLTFEMEAGWLEKERADQIKAKIESM